MIDSDILIKLTFIFKKFNNNQKIIANKIISEGEYAFIENNNIIYIVSKNREVFEFFEFVKSKCNCG